MRCFVKTAVGPGMPDGMLGPTCVWTEGAEMDTDGLAAVAHLSSVIEHLREGEEGGHTENTLPTPGQFLRRLHELPGEERLHVLGTVLALADAGRRCDMELHDANLGELRQRTMTAWGALSRIGALCRDRDAIPAKEINDLMPEALRRG